MKLNKSLVAALCLCVVVVVGSTLAAAQTDDSSQTDQLLLDGGSADGQSFNQQQQQQQQQRRGGSSSPLGFLNVILNPIRSTIEHTRNFLGAPMKSAQRGFDRVQERTFRLFMRLYNKTYPVHELPERMRLFFKRQHEIRESVQKFREGRESFSMKLNEFVDWNDDELKQLTGVSVPRPEEMLPEDKAALAGQESRRRRKRRSAAYFESDEANEIGEHHDDDEDDDQDDDDDDDDDIGLNVGESIPVSKDWRTSGCIADPVDQKNCGACYAIATMGTMESMSCLNQESSGLLSAQHIVDCSSAYKNFGCNGGWPTRVLKYLQDTGVATREVCYPFVRRQTSCRVRQVAARPGCAVKASVSGSNSRLNFKVLTSERDILYYVATRGPVVTVMQASNAFLYYGQGIFDDRTCTRRKDDVDHAIQIVGYGRENGIDYWLIKNSWGKNWGQAGYGKYKRGVHACSIGYWGWALL